VDFIGLELYPRHTILTAQLPVPSVYISTLPLACANLAWF